MSTGGMTCLKKGICLVDFQLSSWQKGTLTLRWRTRQVDNFGDLYKIQAEIPQLSAAGTASSLSALHYLFSSS